MRRVSENRGSNLEPRDSKLSARPTELLNIILHRDSFPLFSSTAKLSLRKIFENRRTEIKSIEAQIFRGFFEPRKSIPAKINLFNPSVTVGYIHHENLT